jgi:hypothetical protein
MKHHATTGFELARVHAFRVAAVHRCVRQYASGPVLALATALDALDLTLERGSAHAMPRTTTAKRLNCDRGRSALST